MKQFTSTCFFIASFIACNFISAMKEGAEAFNKTIEKGAPAFVMFALPDCSACKELKPIFQVDVVKKMGTIAQFIYLDATKAENKKLIEKYGIGSFPTFLYFEGNEQKPADRILGSSILVSSNKEIIAGNLIKAFHNSVTKQQKERMRR